MKREKLLESIEEMRALLNTIKVLAESVVPYEVAESVIDKLAADASRLGVDGLPSEFLRQCQIRQDITLK